MRIGLMPTEGLVLTEERLASLPFGKAEAARLRAIGNQKHAAESLAARLALCSLLEPGEHPICRGTGGKPRFARSDAPRFGLSHAAGLAAAALSEDEVGLDLELLRPYPGAHRIAKRFFTPAEQALYASLGGDALAFFRVYTRKEAYGKLIGSGFFSEPTDAPLFFKTYKLRTDGRTYLLTLCSFARQSVYEWRMPHKEDFYYELLS